MSNTNKKVSPQELRDRFGLRDGQFFAYYRLKNQNWFLNDRPIGYGDLQEVDILMIQEQLQEGEVFFGYNEHHGTEWQQRSTPMVRITKDEITFPEHRR